MKEMMERDHYRGPWRRLDGKVYLRRSPYPEAMRTRHERKAMDAAMKAAASPRLRGILNINEAPLVSVDFNHDPASSTFDATQTQVVGGKLVRVVSWYDNEWGFSNRMLDTAVAMGKLK